MKRYRVWSTTYKCASVEVNQDARANLFKVNALAYTVDHRGDREMDDVYADHIDTSKWQAVVTMYKYEEIKEDQE